MEFTELSLNNITPVELGGNGLGGNGIDCVLETTDFDSFLKELE